MNVSLTSRIRQIITQLEKYPNESMDIDLAVPYKLLQKLNKHFIEVASSEKNGNQIIKKEIEANRIEDVIRRTLFKLLPLGVTYSSNPELVEKSIQYILEYIVKNYPVHLVWSSVNWGVPYPDKEVEQLDLRVNLTRLDLASPWEEIHYGVENSLFFWSGHNWIITPLGTFLKSLSIPTGTVFLLMLENYLNVPERKTPFNINPWHISKPFLAALLKKGCSYLDVGEGKYDLADFDPNMYLINRMDQFQLTDTIDLTEENRSLPNEINGIPVIHIADDFYKISLTSYGKEIVNRVLDESPNILRSMIENLITFELSSQQYYEATNDESIYRLEELAKSNMEIVGDQSKPLQDITKALRLKKTDILILRALPPTIEKVLKNILIDTNMITESDNRITLGGIITKFEGANVNQVVIKYETLQYVKSIERNSLMHGSITPNEGMGEALSNLMINVLIKIFEDYSQWKLNSKTS